MPNDMRIDEFLLARIAEDADDARRAAFGWGEVWSQEIHEEDGWAVVHASGKRDVVGCEDVDITTHIARQDPARVLAECEAKRAIIELHKTWPVLITKPAAIDQNLRDIDSYVFRITQGIAWQTTTEYIARFGTDPPTAPILALLALPYADHPDFQHSWSS